MKKTIAFSLLTLFFIENNSQFIEKQKAALFHFIKKHENVILFSGCVLMGSALLVGIPSVIIIAEPFYENRQITIDPKYHGDVERFIQYDIKFFSSNPSKQKTETTLITTKNFDNNGNFFNPYLTNRYTIMQYLYQEFHEYRNNKKSPLYNDLKAYTIKIEGYIRNNYVIKKGANENSADEISPNDFTRWIIPLICVSYLFRDKEMDEMNILKDECIKNALKDRGIGYSFTKLKDNPKELMKKIHSNPESLYNYLFDENGVKKTCTLFSLDSMFTCPDNFSHD